MQDNLASTIHVWCEQAWHGNVLKWNAMCEEGKSLVLLEKMFPVIYCKLSVKGFVLYLPSPNKQTCSHHTCSCCCLANSICCLCFSNWEAAIFFCSSWADRSCSLKLISWPIMVESCCSFSSSDSGVPEHHQKKLMLHSENTQCRIKKFPLSLREILSHYRSSL